MRRGDTRQVDTGRGAALLGLILLMLILVGCGREAGSAPADIAGRQVIGDALLDHVHAQRGEGLEVSVELVETCSSRIVWTEAFEHRRDDTFRMLDEIVNRIVAAIAAELAYAMRLPACSHLGDVGYDLLFAPLFEEP